MEENHVITNCVHCSINIKAPSNMAGHKAKCPNCGELIVIGLNKQYVTYNDVHREEPPKTPVVKSHIDISGIYFKASRHRRYNNGKWDGSENKNCLRAFEIKSDPKYDGSYLVTLTSLDGINPHWGDNIQMSPKRMEVISSSDKMIELRGFGSDPMQPSGLPRYKKTMAFTST